MTYGYCGYQNYFDTEYCSGYGRKFRVGHTKVLAFAVVCLMILGIGLVNLFPWIDGIWKIIGGGTDIGVAGAAREEAVSVGQVIPMEDGSVAVLYTDGTVRVSGNAAFSEAVSQWSGVERLYYDRYSAFCEYGPMLAALTEDGTVLSTAQGLPRWNNVKELYFHWQGAVAVTNDGRILSSGDWDGDAFFAGMTDVEALANCGMEWGCLKKDGSVVFNYDMDAYGIYWTNVEELRASDHGFYAILKDGSVTGGFDGAKLTPVVKAVDFEDWLFGISADGKLVTQSGGNIYTNAGDLVVDAPGLPYYGREVDPRQLAPVRDILPFCGLILLYEDGTVEHIGEYPVWELSAWENVQKIYGASSGFDVQSLYGILQDGSVVMNRFAWEQDTQTVETQYRGWKLQELYTGNGGVVGVTVDGKLVGDGIYENTDFSIFER